MDPVPNNTHLQESKVETMSELQNYQSNKSPSKAMLRVLLNRIKWKAEGILTEEHAGYRTKTGTVEHIFNIRMLIEKRMQHQCVLCHNSIDFK